MNKEKVSIFGASGTMGYEAFKELWQEVNNVICEVCDTRTFADLVAFEKARRDKCALNYSI